MCIEKLKEKWRFYRKEYLLCTVAELVKKKEQSKHLGISMIISSAIIEIAFLEFYLETNIGISIMGVMIGISVLFVGIDQINDINRVNMWIYLKRMNGE